MNNFVNETFNEVSKVAGNAATKKITSNFNPADSLREIVVAYSDYKKIAAEEKTKRTQINAWKEVELKRIKAQRDSLMTYLDKSFDERKNNFEKFFEVLDNAVKNKEIEVISVSLQAITDLAKSSPFKDIASIAQVHKMIENKDEPINL